MLLRPYLHPNPVVTGRRRHTATAGLHERAFTLRVTRSDTHKDTAERAETYWQVKSTSVPQLVVFSPVAVGAWPSVLSAGSLYCA
eukprot:1195049-Prorocentrum_minimum.AAC.1